MRVNRTLSYRTGFYVLVLPLLVSCGFQLRTEPQFSAFNLFLDSQVERDIRFSIEKYAHTQGVTVSSSKIETQPGVDAVEELIQERVMSFDATGRATEYRLGIEWRVDYTVRSKPENTKLLTAHTYGLNESSLLGVRREGEVLIDRLRYELAMELLSLIQRRLEAEESST